MGKEKEETNDWAIDQMFEIQMFKHSVEFCIKCPIGLKINRIQNADLGQIYPFKHNILQYVLPGIENVEN